MPDEKIPNFSNASWLYTLRFWLIQRLAGKAAIVLNVKIDVVQRQPEYTARIRNMRGGLVASSVLYADEQIMLEFSPAASHNTVEL